MVFSSVLSQEFYRLHQMVLVLLPTLITDNCCGYQLGHCVLVWSGLQMIPLPARFSQTATDVTQGKAGRGNVQMNGENESWIELWNAVPAWAQGSGQIGEKFV